MPGRFRGFGRFAPRVPLPNTAQLPIRGTGNGGLVVRKTA